MPMRGPFFASQMLLGCGIHVLGHLAGQAGADPIGMVQLHFAAVPWQVPFGQQDECRFEHPGVHEVFLHLAFVVPLVEAAGVAQVVVDGLLCPVVQGNRQLQLVLLALCRVIELATSASSAVCIALSSISCPIAAVICSNTFTATPRFCLAMQSVKVIILD